MTHIIVDDKALCRAKEPGRPFVPVPGALDREDLCGDCLYIIEVQERIDERKIGIALERAVLRKELAAQNPR